jgi:hypothetical protein
VSDGSNRENASDFDEVEKQHRPLIERLRKLRWPEPPAGVRERRLDELRDVLGRMRGEPAAPSDDPPER